MERTILACMILVPFVPFMVIMGIGYYYFTASIEQNALSSLKRIVEDHRQMIDGFLAERLADLRFVQKSYAYLELCRPSALEAVFEHLREGSSAFIDLGVFDERGLHVAYHGPYALGGKNYNEEDWFREVLNNGVYISDVFLGFRQVPHFIIAVAKTTAGDRWVLRATIDSKFFNDLVRNVRIGATGEAYLISSEGVFQASEERYGGQLMEKAPHADAFLQAHQGIRTAIAGEGTGTWFLYATTWLKNKNWLLVVRQTRDDAFSALRSAAIRIVFISLIGGAAIVCVALYLTRFIVRRIRKVDAEKNQLGEQLIRAGRLAEIGEMATGFAHEINNPLQIIKSEQALVEMIMGELKQSGDLKSSANLKEAEDCLAQIRQQVERCAAITRAILKFGRKSEPVAARIDLNAFIPEVMEMVARKADVHGIAITCGISAKAPAVMGDPGQLQQVLLNMFNNAIDAIVACRGNAGGALSIRTLETADGRVEIAVEDNGCGIPAANIEKIFTPFFTTKPVGRGTGLGLSVCYGIVTKMGGDMSVKSTPGQGTTFIIRLPAERSPDKQNGAEKWE